MDKTEIKQIADFLNDVYEGLCEGDEEAAMRLHLTELYRVIKWLMDATFATKNQDLKVLLATLKKSKSVDYRLLHRPPAALRLVTCYLSLVTSRVSPSPFRRLAPTIRLWIRRLLCSVRRRQSHRR